MTPPDETTIHRGNRAADDPLDILMICTANRCRSPLAEVIAVEQLARRGVSAMVTSAGFLEGGVEAAAGSRAAAQRRGLDLTGHRSTRLSTQMVNAADVVIAMEPGHIFDLAELVPGSRAWSLTLKELVHFTTQEDPDTTRGPMSPKEIREWVRRVGSRDLQSLLMGDKTVEDPIGRSNRAFRTTADEIHDLLRVLFDMWFGPAPEQ